MVARGAQVMVDSVVAPEKIFEHAGCFHQALNALHAVAPHPQENLHGALTLAEPMIVLGALTTELFLKCLACIETGKPSRGHNLRQLFDELSTEIRARIEKAWNSEIASRRAEEWNRIEAFGLSIPRDLSSALTKGGESFNRIRYSYEGNTDGVHFYVGDLPALLENIILEIKPEFEIFRRKPLPLPWSHH